MTDHEKLLVAALSTGAEADLDWRRVTAPAVMTLLYELAASKRPAAPATPAGIPA